MEEDRVIAPDDEKKRVLDLSASVLPVPSVGIYDGTVRYYKANLAWASIIEGFLSWLTSIAAWAEADNEGYAAIQQISIFLEGIEPVTFDCSDVEDCLESSAIIDAIEGDISTIQGDVTTIEGNVTNITNIINSSPQGGNVTPSPASYETDKLCNAAEYVKTKLIAFIAQTIDDASTITLEEFLTGLLLGGGWDASLLKLAWDYFVASSNPSLLTEVEDAAEQIVTALYCNSFDRSAFVADIDVDTSITDDAQAAIIGAFNAVTDAQLSLWAFVGSETATGVCACANTKVWNFAAGSQLGWEAEGGDSRATWSGNGWTRKIMFYGNVIVIQRPFTWPSDLVLTTIRVYMENRSGADYVYTFGMPYVNGFNTLNPVGADALIDSIGYSVGTRTGLGVEFSIFTEAGQKIVRIEADYTGTEPSDW